MLSTKLFCSHAALMFLCLYFSSCKGAQRNASAESDTTLLAANDQSITINADKTFYQAALLSSGKKFSAGKKVLLLLDAPSVLQNPDGVYEVYISGEKIDVKTLSSSHPGFINVMDLYVLTEKDAPRYLSFDLTKKIMTWANDRQPFPPLTVTILFRGNVLPGNQESKQAGKMTLKDIKIVQE